MRRRWPADEQGGVAIEFALAAGVLLIPIAALVTVFPTWAERQSMARVAAQEAARAVVLADDWAAGTAAGAVLAAQIAVNHGLDASDMTLAWSGGLERGESVTATITVTIPAVVIPGIGDTGEFDWTVAHSEPVDAYRSFEE